MKRICSLAALLVFVLGFAIPAAFAQYDFLLGKEDIVDSSNAVTGDSTAQAADSARN